MQQVAEQERTETNCGCCLAKFVCHCNHCSLPLVTLSARRTLLIDPFLTTCKAWVLSVGDVETACSLNQSPALLHHLFELGAQRIQSGLLDNVVLVNFTIKHFQDTASIKRQERNAFHLQDTILPPLHSRIALSSWHMLVTSRLAKGWCAHRSFRDNVWHVIYERTEHQQCAL